jgi:hypothetical protein
MTFLSNPTAGLKIDDTLIGLPENKGNLGILAADCATD